MRIANLNDRAVIVAADGTAIDIERASQGTFGPDLAGIYRNWDGFVTWATRIPAAVGEVTIDLAHLGSPSPEPTQVFAIGLNYGEHARESGFDAPDRLPPVFTKFRTAITGPNTTVILPTGGNTDWEVELVVVIGSVAKNVSVGDAWGHVAGLTIGQDISERVSQLAGPAPQFGLAKSFDGFAPVGPWLVTIDEFDNPDDLALGSRLDGEVMQSGRTNELLFSVSHLIQGLSRVVTLLPGDLIFTGTPSGVGMGRTPARYIQPGETLVSWIEGIGEMTQIFVAEPHN